MSKIPDYYSEGFLMEDDLEGMDKNTKEIANAILDILRSAPKKDMSVARAKSILRMCENFIEHITIVKP